MTQMLYPSEPARQVFKKQKREKLENSSFLKESEL